MERTYIKNLADVIGSEVVVKGFVQTIRNQGSIKFLIIRDITGIVQAVVLKSEAAAFELAGQLTTESVVEVSGMVKTEKQAPAGYEIAVKTLEILSLADPELPIPVLAEKGGDDTEQTKRLDWRWLDLRKEDNALIFKVWTEFERGFRTYLEQQGFIQIYTPSFMSTPSESGAEVFEVGYFDRKAYLAQSPQFYKQMAMASGLEKVFMVGPVFRAEPSYTTRHMTEFTGWDYEMSFIESHHDIMAAEIGMLVAGFEQVKKTLDVELKRVFDIDLEVPSVEFPKITLTDAKALLKNLNIRSEKEHDLNAEEERELGRVMKEKTGHDFLFVIDWPIKARPFYHMRFGENMELTKSADLLYKGLEITTLAQREHRPELLDKQLLDKGMDAESLRYYTNFFRYGCPPHGGAGIGPGRILMQMLNVASVKEVTFLPRDVKRLKP